MQIKLFSPAKVNLFLRVVGRREDGYHNLASLFQAIDLCDTLEFELASSDQLLCDYPHIPKDSSNLVWRAANLFRKKSALDFKIKVTLQKRIPKEAGLGGGSSNAATTLWALNQLFDTPFSEDELRSFAAEIGSDIPFFFSSGRAYCTGRGECVRSLPYQASHVGLIVKPEVGLSTAEVFSRLSILECSSKDPEELLSTFCSGGSDYLNDLEKPAFAMVPILKDLKERLLQAGCHSVILTGSGTAFFCESVLPLPSSFAAIPVNFLHREPHSWY